MKNKRKMSLEEIEKRISLCEKLINHLDLSIRYAVHVRSFGKDQGQIDKCIRICGSEPLLLEGDDYNLAKKRVDKQYRKLNTYRQYERNLKCDTGNFELEKEIARWKRIVSKRTIVEKDLSWFSRINTNVSVDIVSGFQLGDTVTPISKENRMPENFSRGSKTSLGGIEASIIGTPFTPPDIPYLDRIKLKRRQYIKNLILATKDSMQLALLPCSQNPKGLERDIEYQCIKYQFLSELRMLYMDMVDDTLATFGVERARMDITACDYYTRTLESTITRLTKLEAKARTIANKNAISDEEFKQMQRSIPNVGIPAVQESLNMIGEKK